MIVFVLLILFNLFSIFRINLVYRDCSMLGFVNGRKDFFLGIVCLLWFLREIVGWVFIMIGCFVLCVIRILIIFFSSWVGVFVGACLIIIDLFTLLLLINVICIFCCVFSCMPITPNFYNPNPDTYLTISNSQFATCINLYIFNTISISTLI